MQGVGSMKEKLLKTFLYRVTASSLAQLVSWVFFRKIEVNAFVLSVDLIQMVYYFFFESIWNINRNQSLMIKKLVMFMDNWWIKITIFLRHQKNTIKDWESPK